MEWRAAMLTPEKRGLLTEQQDQLIELYVEQNEATRAADWGRVRALQIEIDNTKEQLDGIRATAE
jgi:hypothetical protein